MQAYMMPKDQISANIGSYMEWVNSSGAMYADEPVLAEQLLDCTQDADVNSTYWLG